jgi:hypothetical protein
VPPLLPRLNELPIWRAPAMSENIRNCQRRRSTYLRWGHNNRAKTSGLPADSPNPPTQEWRAM